MSTQHSNSGLTPEEQSTFERIAQRFEGEDVGMVAETVLQSSTDSEEARS